MVTTVTSYTEMRNRALIGGGYDGVVRVVIGEFYGSGVLLFGGSAVLTAAHLFSGSNLTANVIFETLSGVQTIASSLVVLNPDYYSTINNADLALIWLSQDAPVTSERFNIFRSSSEIGQTITIVGYGKPGLGITGTITNFNEVPVRVKANNQFDCDIAPLDNFFSESGLWAANNGKQLVADFDSGFIQNDALGRLVGISDLGLGNSEGLISKGDSGGPAFIGDLVAGIASYTGRLNAGPVVPDIDKASNSSFGEVAIWQRVSAYQQWIDQTLREHFQNPPMKLADVKTSETEGDVGVKPVYFWIQFNGQRKESNSIVSVDYKTRDGSAIAGQDYIGTQGTLNIYPNEDHALVCVEIIGDNQPEIDETFFLDIFNPVGANFEASVVKLTAMRTIVNDDGWVWG